MQNLNILNKKISGQFILKEFLKKKKILTSTLFLKKDKISPLLSKVSLKKENLKRLNLWEKIYKKKKDEKKEEKKKQRLLNKKLKAEKKLKYPANAILYGQFTKQNSIFTLCNIQGKVITTLSNGIIGFKNSQAKTKYATQKTAETISNKAKKLGFTNVIFILKGTNKGRKKCTKSIKKGGLYINYVIDQTPMIHNGCRPEKQPRR